MQILITGAAGFIGFSTAKRLLERGHNVIGIDNLNSYYSVDLKLCRLSQLGIELNSDFTIQSDNNYHTSSKYPKFKFKHIDISNFDALKKIFETQKFDIVCNLAAQAGVRYSFENPSAYIQSNIVGFANILECCRQYSVKHFVYASSSSVYGNSNSVPFSEKDCVERPESLYAATKKSDELMAYVYSKQLGLTTTGLRYFTVYGPWGRPDMAPFMFMRSIIESKPIKVFNNGNLERDFSYIDDIVTGTVKVIEEPAESNSAKIYNIGNSHPVKLMDFIATIEKYAGKKAIMEFTGMQRGDVYITYADTSAIEKDFDFRPNTPLSEGIEKFHKWYIDFYKLG